DHAKGTFWASVTHTFGPLEGLVELVQFDSDRKIVDRSQLMTRNDINSRVLAMAHTEDGRTHAFVVDIVGELSELQHYTKAGNSWKIRVIAADPRDGASFIGGFEVIQAPDNGLGVACPDCRAIANSLEGIRFSSVNGLTWTRESVRADT